MKNLATNGEFIANLKSGKAWEEIVAKRFREAWFDAKAAPLRIRPGVAVRRRFADNGDVLQSSYNHGHRSRGGDMAADLGLSARRFRVYQAFSAPAMNFLADFVAPGPGLIKPCLLALVGCMLFA